MAKTRKALLDMFKIGVSGVCPRNLIKASVKVDPHTSEVHICDQVFGPNLKYHVFGFGKAVSGMARALQDVLKAQIVDGALSVPVALTHLPKIQTFVAGQYNLPDENSLTATEAILTSIAHVPEDDVVIILISGGGSSLFCKPLPGLTLEDKLLTIRQLVQAGADIRELNTVRKRLSAVKGGRLGESLGNRRTVCLILSDIVGDPLDLIASGPTVPNTDDPAAALEVLRKYKLELKVPRNVMNIVRTQSQVANNSHSDDGIVNRIIGSNLIALKNILEASDPPNCQKLLVSGSLQGAVTDVAFNYSRIATEIMNLLSTSDSGRFVANVRTILRTASIVPDNQAFITQLLTAAADTSMECLVLLMGGETTVKLSGSGVGGRNQELAVRFSQLLHDFRLEEQPSLCSDWNAMLLSAGTDGIDGPTDAAGAFGCEKLIVQAKQLGLDVDSYLNNNDSFTFLSAVDNGKYLIKTGHTGTNVMDLHLLAVYKNTYLQ